MLKTTKLLDKLALNRNNGNKLVSNKNDNSRLTFKKNDNNSEIRFSDDCIKYAKKSGKSKG